VVALRVASRLRNGGLSLKVIIRVVEYLKAHPLETAGNDNNPLAYRVVIADGADVYERTRDQLFSLLQAPGQGVVAMVDPVREAAELEKELETKNPVAS